MIIKLKSEKEIEEMGWDGQGGLWPKYQNDYGIPTCWFFILNKIHIKVKKSAFKTNDGESLYNLPGIIISIRESLIKIKINSRLANILYPESYINDSKN